MSDTANNIWGDGPISNPKEPKKSEIRSWGTDKESRITALESGLDEVAAIAGSRIKSQIIADLATTSNITLSGEQTIDGVTTSSSTALVKNRTDEAQNGVYVTGAGSWTRHTGADTSAELVGLSVFVTAGTVNGETTWLCIADNASTTYPFVILGAGAQSAKIVGGTVNLFDYLAVTEGQEVYADGTLQVQANSSISDKIYVKGMGSLTIRGLQAGSTAGPWSRFLAADKTTVVAVENLTDAMTAPVTIPVPPDAEWFQFSPRQRNASAAAYGGIQLEFGTRATSAENYTERVVAVDGNRTPVPRHASFLLFGDSITATATKDMSGGYTEGVQPNWPTYAMPMLGADSWYNYATSGASFREYGGQEDLQKIYNQVSRAYADGRSANYVVLANGTNDYATGLPNLGDYATAMGKATRDDLDRSKTLEAARWAMWTIQIHWPMATPFCVLPIQRADIEPAAMQSLTDGLRALAERYGFIVIDGAAEAGIVKDFEIWDPDKVIGPGRDLEDGLHPHASGMVKMARMIARHIQPYLAVT